MSYTSFRALLAGRCDALDIRSQAQLRRELAEQRQVTLSRETVSRWFRGDVLPSGDVLEALLDVLKVDDVEQRERAHRMVSAPGADGIRPVVA